ncbi:cysteine desulfurase mitochondrial-like [Senna tora]|uniref:Cysteine desulfurase mitochondrial-like n=1 Tax=Senna tora TaxID=362788 RepID=A0A834SHT8_9FABA|nr:cysteine desulfurase mitochondrial-like [Senna tora]
MDAGNNEEILVLIDEEDVANRVEKFRRVLIGKLISTKQANMGALENAFRNIWGQPRGFKGEKIGHNLFLFHFNDEEAMNRAMEGGPWSFRNRWLVLLRWRCGIAENDKAFSRVKFWVQIWGAPLHCRTEKVAHKLCAALGKVFKVGLYKDVTTGNVFMKWLIEFELKNCLQKGMNMGNPNDGIHWLDLRYEKIPKYCAKCGYFGHDDDECELEKMALKIGEVFISKYLGSWLKVREMRKKVALFEKRNTQVEGNEDTRRKVGMIKKIEIEALLERMAMTMKDGPPKINETNKEELERETIGENHNSMIMESMKVQFDRAMANLDWNSLFPESKGASVWI